MNELWEILVPSTFNDGTEVPVAHHRKWDDFVRRVAGGLTILRSAQGVWQSPDGTVFREKMIPVRVACSENQMRDVMTFTMSHYGQLAAMAYRVSQHVIIQHARS